jgi:hypothetical protein
VRRVLISVEGQPEEAFVGDPLARHLLSFEVSVQPVILATKRMASGAKFRGGVSGWTKIESELRRLVADGDAMVTTMYDL